MTEEEEIQILYRFCGNHEPHTEHTFWRDHGVMDGGKNYDCLGWMTWRL